MASRVRRLRYLRSRFVVSHHADKTASSSSTVHFRRRFPTSLDFKRHPYFRVTKRPIAASSLLAPMDSSSHFTLGTKSKSSTLRMDNCCSRSICPELSLSAFLRKGPFCVYGNNSLAPPRIRKVIDMVMLPNSVTML